MKAHIARCGIPNISDNDSNFTSKELKLFTDSYKIEHITSSPTYAQSNAENSAKTPKKIMQKTRDAQADPYLAFPAFRNTPTEG